MSQAARAQLVSRLVFQNKSQKSDLLDAGQTQTQLIAIGLEITSKGYILEVTAVRKDHGNDAYLGLHSHANGYCMDCWPLKSKNAGDYLDATDPKFQAFLEALSDSPWLYQIGLVGDGADSPENFVAAGKTAFQDDGGPHVHIGANGP